MNTSLTIATYNIHKGMSAFNRRHVLPALKQALDGLSADLVFLQEVQGEHRGRADRHADWPDASQQAYLGDGHHHVYGRNAEYGAGHHGNALLSRFPIGHSYNHDLSLNRLERRGLLHAIVQVPGWSADLHGLCVHLNLRASDRRRQLESLRRYVEAHVPSDAPLILAGDFNDWRGEACGYLQESLGLRDAYRSVHGRLAPSFPSTLPMLPLDRIYLRGFQVQQAEVHAHGDWRKLSDHAAMTAKIRVS